MVLFQETNDHPHISQLKCRDKTKTRRDSKRWIMKVGGIYPAHDASKGLYQKKEDAELLIRCTDRYEEPLGDMTEAEACLEGQYTLPEFKRLWIGIADMWKSEKIIKVYEVEPVEG